MYTAKIITDAGKTFNFGYEHGTLFDIEPLSGTNVNVLTSQGTGQIGTTVENQAVGGINRTISGLVLNKETATYLLSTLPAFTTGKLFVNDVRYCNIVVNRTPEISFKKDGRMPFTMRVYCATPFWSESQLKFKVLSGIIKMFKFPTKFNQHMFGRTIQNAFINVFNEGDVSTPLKCVFTSSATVENYGIQNIRTFEKLEFNDTLRVGETATVYFENTKLYAYKEDELGNVTQLIHAITDDSNLFLLTKGDNILKSTADVNESNLYATVSFRPQYMGVVV